MGALLLLLVGLEVICGATPLAGQEPERLEGDGVVFLHAPSQRALAIDFLNAWPLARERVVVLTGARPPGPITVELVDSFDALSNRVRAATGAELPSWVAGVALPEQDLVVIRTDLEGPRGRRIKGILTHELAHVAVAARARARGLAPLPRWLDEGLAQLAEGRLLVDDAPNLPMRAFFGQLIPLATLEDHFPAAEGASALAYAEAESFVSFLVRLPGIDAQPRVLVDRLMDGVPLDQAVRSLTFLSLEEIEARWRASLRGDKSWMLGLSVQIGFGLFVLLVVMVAVPRFVRRRRAALARWAEEEEEDLEDSPPPLAWDESRPPESREEPEERARPFRRRPGWLPVRRLRPGEDDPVP